MCSAARCANNIPRSVLDVQNPRLRSCELCSDGLRHRTSSRIALRFLGRSPDPLGFRRRTLGLIGWTASGACRPRGLLDRKVMVDGGVHAARSPHNPVSSTATLGQASVTESSVALPPEIKGAAMPKLECAIPSFPDMHLMPACPQCSAQMKIVRVTPADEGLEDRTFECLKCHHVGMWVFKTI